MTVKDGCGQPSYLSLDWPDKPRNVKACATLISGGVSDGGYAEFNLATHVGDEPEAVEKNREKLINDLALSTEPVWLEQVHSNKVFSIDEKSAQGVSDKKPLQPVPQADASVTRQKGQVCVVLTADCLPVFFSNTSGTEVAVAHAGWRGLHAGIISNTIETMESSVNEIVVSFGPAIGPRAFEVGEEVRQAFVDKNRDNRDAFTESQGGRYLCDIYQLARFELQALGVDPARISGGEYCTYSEKDRFYSFRRQGNTGRMASLIWLA